MPAITVTRSAAAGEISFAGESTPAKRKLRSNSAADDCHIILTPSPKVPRRCAIASSPISPSNGTENEIGAYLADKHDLVKKLSLQGTENEIGAYLADKHDLVKKLSYGTVDQQKWKPNDLEQLSAVKEVLHVSSVPSMVVCREDEQNKIFEFCKQCIENNKSGSLYACGCPGTGKSLSMETVKKSLMDWAKKDGFLPPDVLAINCTSLTNTSEIFTKILGENQPRKRTKNEISALQHLQRIYSNEQQSSGMKMMLIIADELDYLITKDRAVLHELFMLTTLPFSRCVLIGIANSIDLADRFLPRLQSLNCKPKVVTFRAYTKDQILRILRQRLMKLPYIVFQPQALELCARKVAAASGDMRNALHICRSAIEVLEAELGQYAHDGDLLSTMSEYSDAPNTPHDKINQGTNFVRVDHMAIALSKSYKSSVVDTIQSLPQHQQIILCSAVKHFRKGKKDTTVGELSRSYIDICKSILIPPVGTAELSSMCRVLSDQGLLKLGQSRQDKLARVTLKVDEVDIVFALQGVRVFRNCLQ